MTATEETEQQVWWAFRPANDAGVWVPYPPFPLHSLNELPTDEEVKRAGRPAIRFVELPGGEAGEAEGFLTPEADFYVAVSADVVMDMIAKDAEAV